MSKSASISYSPICSEIREEIDKMDISNLNPDIIHSLLMNTKQLCPNDHIYLSKIKELLVEKNVCDKIKSYIPKLEEKYNRLRYGYNQKIEKLQNENEDYVYQISQIKKELKRRNIKLDF